jgi:hypothetical protein
VSGRLGGTPVAVVLVVDGLVDLPSVREGSLSAIIATVVSKKQSGNNTQKMIC